MHDSQNTKKNTSCKINIC